MATLTTNAPEDESRFRLLFERSPDCVLLFDIGTGKFFDCNHAALTLLRCDRAWLVDKHPWELAPPSQPCGTSSEVKAKEIIGGTPATTGSMHFEWEHARGDGTTFPADISVTAIQLEFREVWFCVVRDITAAKRAAAKAAELQASLESRVEERTAQLALANAQLRETQQHLLQALAVEKELNELKSNFVSMVSHEFRTPLGVIMVSSELLGRYLDRLSPEQRTEQLEAISENVQRMSRMMEDVLLLSRVEAGGMASRPAELNLRLFCTRVMEEVCSSAGRAGEVLFSTDEAVPRLGMGDENLVRHILTNLLSNALKYSPPGVPVHLRIHRSAGQAVFTIADRGIGIPAADQARVFDIFHRARNVGQINGTGLGLVIVKRCCDLHGGAIELESEEGKGATFTVKLPLFESEEDRMPA